jgi:hypothetical protein
MITEASFISARQWAAAAATAAEAGADLVQLQPVKRGPRGGS